MALVVVTYNSESVIGQCLESTLDQGVSTEVWVVDNNSTDGTVPLVRGRFPWVHVHVNPENVGFGRANNQVLPFLKAEYIFCLNPDAYLFPGCLGEAVRFLEAHPEVGMAGTRIVYPDGSEQDSVSSRYPNQKFVGDLFQDLPGRIACLQGSSLILRLDFMRELGGFDPDFFLYGEDQDLSLRVRKRQMKLAVIEAAQVGHRQGHTEKATGLEWTWNRKLEGEYLFYQKHYPPEAIRRIRRAHQRKSAWVLATQYLGGLLGGSSDRRMASRAKYGAMWRTSRRFKG